MKKSSLIILVIGVILLILGVIFYLKPKESLYKTDKIYHDDFEINFPIYDNLKNDLFSKNSKVYKTDDEKKIVSAFSYESNKNLEDEISFLIKEMKSEKASIESSVKVDYKEVLIYKVKYSDNNMAIMGVELSNNNYFFVSYNNKDEEFLDKDLLKLAKQIEVKNGSVFKIGIEKDNKLIIPLKLYDRISLIYEVNLVLDNKKYKEENSKINDYNITTIKKVDDNSIINVHLYDKKEDELKTFLFDELSNELKDVVIKDIKCKYILYKDRKYYIIPLKEDLKLIIELANNIDNKIVEDFINYDIKK